jgi:hypothetical protein
MPLSNPLNWAVGKPSPSPGALRTPARTDTGERVYIVDKQGSADQPIMVSEDGRRWIEGPGPHILTELTESES